MLNFDIEECFHEILIDYFSSVLSFIDFQYANKPINEALIYVNENIESVAKKAFDNIRNQPDPSSDFFPQNFIDEGKEYVKKFIDKKYISKISENSYQIILDYAFKLYLDIALNFINVHGAKYEELVDDTK